MPKGYYQNDDYQMGNQSEDEYYYRPKSKLAKQAKNQQKKKQQDSESEFDIDSQQNSVSQSSLGQDEFVKESEISSDWSEEEEKRKIRSYCENRRSKEFMKKKSIESVYQDYENIEKSLNLVSTLVDDNGFLGVKKKKKGKYQKVGSRLQQILEEMNLRASNKVKDSQEEVEREQYFSEKKNIFSKMKKNSGPVLKPLHLRSSGQKAQLQLQSEFEELSYGLEKSSKNEKRGNFFQSQKNPTISIKNLLCPSKVVVTSNRKDSQLNNFMLKEQSSVEDIDQKYQKQRDKVLENKKSSDFKGIHSHFQGKKSEMSIKPKSNFQIGPSSSKGTVPHSFFQPPMEIAKNSQNKKSRIGKNSKIKKIIQMDVRGGKSYFLVKCKDGVRWAERKELFNGHLKKLVEFYESYIKFV